MPSLVGRIKAISAAPLPAQPLHAPGLLPGWASPSTTSPVGNAWPENRRRYVIHVHDSSGATGSFGPCSAAVVEIMRDQISPTLIDEEPIAWRVLDRTSLLGRHHSGPHVRMAISAIELALWDLRSRSTGLSVGAMLGGAARSVIPVYATCFGLDVDHPLAPDVARWVAHAGFWGQKWRLPGWTLGQEPGADAARLARLREAVGDGSRIMVDAGGAWDAAYTRRMLPVLAESGVVWIEEPGRLSPGDAAAHGLAVAAGEHDYDADQQVATLASGQVQMWQPDPAWNGGLVPSMRMVDVAAILDIPCFPHGSGLVAGVQLAGLNASAVVPAVEYHLTLEPLRQSIATEPLKPVDGQVEVPLGPGLGVCYLDGDDGEFVLAGETHAAS